MEGLAVQRASVDIDGTGKVDLGRTEALDVRISGFGRVGYHGTPTLNVQRSGFGKVVSLDGR